MPHTPIYGGVLKQPDKQEATKRPFGENFATLSLKEVCKKGSGSKPLPSSLRLSYQRSNPAL